MDETTTSFTGRVTVEAFERFMREFVAGSMKRNSFHPWEIELIIDIQECRVKHGRSEQMLRRYRTAARKFLEKGFERPLKMSEYIAGVHRDLAKERVRARQERRQVAS